MKTKTVNVEFNVVVPEDWSSELTANTIKTGVNVFFMKMKGEGFGVDGIVEVATNNKWRIAIESLTPQGSEYHNDLPRCMEAIQYKLNDGHKARVEVVKLRREIDKRRKVI